MGTQGPGRRRIPNRDKLSAEDDALDRIAREAEARLALKRAARAEARDIRMKELERRQKEVEEKPDRDFLDKGCRTASTLSAATLTSLGGASSRRGSCDTSFSVETEASIREFKDSLVEADERYRRAMVSNAQLHNDKSSLMYQVETLREELSDMEEELWESRRHRDHASKALERQREMSDIVVMERDRLRDEVTQLRDLLKKHGITVVSPEITNGEAGRTEDDVSAEPGSRFAQEPPGGGRESMLEVRLNKVSEERQTLQDQVRQLKSELDQRRRTGPDQDPQDALENGMDSHLLVLQRDANRQLSELKFKLVKSEQEVAALEQNIVRLDGQVTRYKSASENAEKVEDELKVEKRKLQREESVSQLRSALDRVDELEVSKGHLTKRLEKMKANRNALLAQH
ncbi:putative leucine-rich repeat flightless-interacting protein 2-like [Scophthalmus maximus]|uniref:Putative leucine-rich repeat flightless-interacting protein 2-like n=1 Tax=Scophthalmus maximus TaxID=52904 RepID=A0A2U9AV45_SCOMX|nr:putative leucine-rich repeat flightless-interacting protein 2-like [Scophthalmus maximus]